MALEYCSKDEIEKERPPSELWDWLNQKVKQICSTQEGLEAFRLQKGLLKKLPEEIAPLAIFGKKKFGDTDQVLLQPIIGSQNYDAKVIDKRTNSASVTYIEITQAYIDKSDGKKQYLRRLELLERGCTHHEGEVEESVKNELDRIIAAAKRKAGKDYPVNTSLIISFDDTTLSEERLRVLKCPTIDSFVGKEIMNLDLRFSQLYLVGEAQDIFREYTIKRQD